MLRETCFDIKILGGHEGSSQLEASITHLASSCRIFRRPSVEAIWTAILCCVVLLYMLPGDAWIVEEGEEDKYEDHEPY